MVITMVMSCCTYFHQPWPVPKNVSTSGTHFDLCGESFLPSETTGDSPELLGSARLVGLVRREVPNWASMLTTSDNVSECQGMGIKGWNAAHHRSDKASFLIFSSKEFQDVVELPFTNT